MHITSGLSPASGEMLDTVFDFYADCGDHSGGTFFTVDNTVPESSHTVEIEYIYEQPETYCKEDEVNETVSMQKESREEHHKQKLESKIEDDSETDLTNLNWLQNITNIMAVPQFPISPVSPRPVEKKPQNTRLDKFNETISKCQEDFMENKSEYQNNSNRKPPYSYSTMICMAMRYNNDKMTLSAIYSWIRENFKYYRTADPTWKNSIRHNLSLNKVFVKVARSKQEPGKGGFWKLDLTHLQGNKRISSRPHKKKNKQQKTSDTVEDKVTEEQEAVANIPVTPMDTVCDESVCLQIPDYNLGDIQPFPSIGSISTDIVANVIVEPVAPPPLIAEEDLSSLVLNPTEWDDLQLDMFDNYLMDSCFK